MQIENAAEKCLPDNLYRVDGFLEDNGRMYVILPASRTWARVSLGPPVDVWVLKGSKTSTGLANAIDTLRGSQIREISSRISGSGLSVEPVDEEERRVWHVHMMKEAQERRLKAEDQRPAPVWEQPTRRYARRFLDLLGLSTANVDRLEEVVERLLDVAPEGAVFRLSDQANDVMFKRDWLEHAGQLLQIG